MVKAVWAPLLALALMLGLSDAGYAGEARFDWFEYQGADPIDAKVILEPGKYRNPILAGFYPDPSVTRVGDDFYLVNSSFGWLPGLPLFHSRDLVNWTQVSNAIDRPGMVDVGKGGLTGGLFAPSISHHDGLYYIVNTCFYCGGNYVITAKDPKGPWFGPVWLPDLGHGIDPSLFFDKDGRAWIVNNDLPAGAKEDYEGHRALWIQEFDPKNLTTKGPRTMIVNGGVDIATKPVYVEGPHLYAKDGFYYLTAAEGGTGPAHAQMIWRSKSPTGPYEPGPVNPILTQRDLSPGRADPVEAAGHADLVQLPNGDWWAVFLAVRPYAGGEMFNTGRDTFLLPVRWVDGWPRILDAGSVIPRKAAKPNLKPGNPGLPTTGPMVIRDDFDGPSLAPYWMTPRRLGGNWHRLADGALHLIPRPVGLGDRADPSLWARRQQHMDARFTTELSFTPDRPGDRAGLAVMQNDEHWYRLTLERAADGTRVVRVAVRAGEKQDKTGKVLATRPVPATGPVQLRVTARGGAYDFLVSAGPEGWVPVLTGADGTILSTATAGGFLGVLAGPYAEAGR
ncbi:glycoside hydrolase family 43 protein [Niveispirillum sp. KHB5.9]|uniref:glycoside hydrolase family 43 protein n=1 Tax=Niveispirillum sp. KHB5.9 TaxID=3400269 RepID=UPI003A870ACF